jgi:hypothetical protein
MPLDDTALTSVSGIITFLLSGATDILTWMTSNEIALIAFGIFVVGGICGILARMFHSI